MRSSGKTRVPPPGCQARRRRSGAPRTRAHRAAEPAVLRPRSSPASRALLRERAPWPSAASSPRARSSAGSPESDRGDRRGAHISDVTNALRTLLFDTGKLAWSDELLTLFDVPAAVLPAGVPTSHSLSALRRRDGGCDHGRRHPPPEDDTGRSWPRCRRSQASCPIPSPRRRACDPDGHPECILARRRNVRGVPLLGEAAPRSAASFGSSSTMSTRIRPLSLAEDENGM